MEEDGVRVGRRCGAGLVAVQPVAVAAKHGCLAVRVLPDAPSYRLRYEHLSQPQSRQDYPLVAPVCQGSVESCCEDGQISRERPLTQVIEDTYHSRLADPAFSLPAQDSDAGRKALPLC